MAVGSYAAGLATSLLFAGSNLWGDAPTGEVELDSAYLTEWPDDWNDPPCMVYNATYHYTNGMCSHLALSRMTAATQSEAQSRALACAAHLETDCLLSPEVGFTVPAAFVYDAHEGVTMLVAPKLLTVPPEANVTERLIALQDPRDGHPTSQLTFADTVHVEYQRGGSRSMTTELLTGSAAYCVQLLRLAFSADCWRRID